MSQQVVKDYSIAEYQESFKSEVYASSYLSDVEYEFQWLVEQFYHRLFSEGKLKGSNLLDVGSGPSVRPALSASGHISDIYLSDLLENNRDFVRKWLKNEPGSFDFSIQFKYVANLEGKQDYKYLEDRVRKAVKDVIHCDLLAEEKPLHPLNPLQQFDVVTSSYCLDCFNNEKDYAKAWKNLGKLVKPGGQLALVGTLDCTNYAIGNTLLPGANVNEATVRRYLEEQFHVVEFKVHEYTRDLAVESDNKGIITAFAIKK